MKSSAFYKAAAILSPAFAAGLALAQTYGGFQAASLKPPKLVTVKPGESVPVEVGVRIRPGYHINSNEPAEDYLIPTKLTWDSGPLKLKNVDYPEGEMVKYAFSSQPLSVYSGEFEIRSTFTAPPALPEDVTQLTGTLRYQACNDKACFPPQKLQVRVPLSAP